MAYDSTSGQKSMIDPSMIQQAYQSGDITKTNQLLADSGMSTTGAMNVSGDMGWGLTPADIQAMQAKGVVFAPSGTSAEDTGWNSNAGTGIVNGAMAKPSPTLSPASVSQAQTSLIGAPTPWNVTPDQTVQGRIASIVNPNDPLMVQARTQADEDSNRRGLINSSMAVTAGEDAMYRAAVPIATADAATAAKAAGYNADQSNLVATKNADAQNQMAQANLGANTSIFNATLGANTQWNVANLNARTTLAQANIGADTQKAIAALNSSTQLGMNALDNQTKLTAQTWASQNQVLLNTSSQAATAFNQYVVSATSIENNANMDAATKTTALKTLWQDTQAQLTILSNLNHLDLTSLLDMSGLDTTIAPTPTPVPTPAPTLSPDNKY